jgi:hypothetical protein
MKASLVAFDVRELSKNSQLKIIKYEYVRGCPKLPASKSYHLKF